MSLTLTVSGLGPKGSNHDGGFDLNGSASRNLIFCETKRAKVCQIFRYARHWDSSTPSACALPATAKLHFQQCSMRSSLGQAVCLPYDLFFVVVVRVPEAAKRSQSTQFPLERLVIAVARYEGDTDLRK